MNIEPIGFLTLAFGAVCLLLGYRAGVIILLVASLLGASAAIIIGAANVQPAQLLLVFVAAAVLAHRREMFAVLQAVNIPNPGFWLWCLLVYGVLAGFVSPRLFGEALQIFPLGASSYADTGSTVPLGPVSGNFSQALYLTSDIVCFWVTAAIASTPSGFVAVATAVLAYAIGNVLFAVLDLATYNTGTQWLLGFMRNAQYTLHNEEQVEGLKRIVGSFPEASTFARSTLGMLGFTGTLWLCGRQRLLTGVLALTSLVLAVLSTSSMGLACTPIVLLVLYLTALTRCGRDARGRNSRAVTVFTPLLAIAAVLFVCLNYAASATVQNYIDLLILDKSVSDSGIERGAWNTAGMQNFFDTYGFGVGLGTVRTSSLPVAILSNVGVPGAIFYLLFLTSAFIRRGDTPGTEVADTCLAARNACLGLIAGDIFVAPTVEQGLLFYALAALAAARPKGSITAVVRG